MEVFKTASDAARDHAVEENYTHTYRDSVEFLSKRVVEKGASIKVANVNPKRIEQLTLRKSQHRGNRNFSKKRPANSYNDTHV